jgi:PBP1b-binding outer membrane lipoprotein LpoB
MKRLSLVILSCFCFGACASAPVQELSDARQAIVAARAAGAATSASADLNAAQTAIASAEAHLQAHEYRRAKFAAVAAKRHAVAALTDAERARAP